jgi:hypothetical protein
MSICLVDPVKRKARLTMLSRCTYSYRLDHHQEDQTILCVDPIHGNRMLVPGGHWRIVHHTANVCVAMCRT